MAPRSNPSKSDVDTVDVPVDELVKARFVDVQAVFSPGQGVITYGAEFWVTAEQLDGDPRLVVWSDDWTPDPALVAAATLEG